MRQRLYFKHFAIQISSIMFLLDYFAYTTRTRSLADIIQTFSFDMMHTTTTAP